MLIAGIIFFVIRWRKLVTAQNQELNAMNANIQEQMIQIRSGTLLALIEKARTPIKYRGSQYNSGGAPELLERLKRVNGMTGTILTSDFGSVGTKQGEHGGDGMRITENSARVVLGASEFSSRALVPTSP
jgi:nitrate reductase beta subunit